jgi:hypothetical protein
MAVLLVAWLPFQASPRFLGGEHWGKGDRTITDMRSIGVALEAWSEDHGGEYPMVQDVLELRPLLEPTYIKRIPLRDGWRCRHFQVESREDGYVIVSFGRGARPDVDDPWTCPPRTIRWGDHDADLVYRNGGFIRCRPPREVNEVGG